MRTDCSQIFVAVPLGAEASICKEITKAGSDFNLERGSKNTNLFPLQSLGVLSLILKNAGSDCKVGGLAVKKENELCGESWSNAPLLPSS